LKTGGYLCLVAQGQTAAVATLAALLDARRGGAGTDVEVAASDANAEMLGMWVGGRDEALVRLGRRHQAIYPWHCYAVRDGWVGVHAGPSSWQQFVEMIGAPELGEFALPAGRREARGRIDAAIERWLSSMSKVEAYHAGQARRFGFGYVATCEDLVRSPQLEARGFFRAIEHPAAPGGRYPGPPFRLQSGWRDARAPLLGEHSDEVSAERGWSGGGSARPAGAAAPSPDTTRPLSGVRVLDLTQIWAGPRATMVLSDYGAEVIKVESRSRTDGTRGYPRYLADREAGRIANEREHNRRGAFEHLHRGERSITLDLRSEPGRAAFQRLVAVSDVVIANFAYGVMERLGSTWADLAPINPRIIVVSMTGFGDSGPERDYVGYGVSQEELSGIYSVTGYEGEEPLKSGTNIGDPMNGMHGAAAVIAALIERDRTGRGQYVELSQLESSVAFIGESILDFTVNGRVTRPAGSSDLLWAPHGMYPTRGEDQWVAMVARDDEEWSRLLTVLDRDELAADRRFERRNDRVAHHVELDAALGSLTATRERDELASALQAAGVPAAPVLTSSEVQHHPQYTATGFVQVATHPDGGEYRYFGPMWRINGVRPPLGGPAPLLGEHTAEVLEALTDLGAEEIAEITGA
jgi:crotonobetainyl-CoA:carnitine CoA-transferase CaiB-like acyl-CoA transferase